MSDTLRLALPLLAPAQAQKHVTHNEALLRLDVLSNASALSRSLSAPPAASEGATYLVGAGASGDWAGHDGKLAHWRDGAWQFLTPNEGLSLLIADEGLQLIYGTGGWTPAVDLTAENHRLACTAHGAETRCLLLESELTGLSGAYAETAPIIPNRAIVFCVSSRTTATVSGAGSYDVGLSGERSKFGGSLGVSAGSTNAGVIGPTAFYGDTPLRISANGGDFTAGSVRLAVHLLLPIVPQS
ncbi:DUF2793 domain-containing protein [Roseibium sp.]|uniref:DUF2793 domain-containing protein n=1 Tax=Roseibium sp. TaxID=1936156 RepID=UPI003A980E60